MRLANRRFVLNCLPLAGVVWVAGCAALLPSRFTLSEADLQRAAERRFPVERRFLDVLDVTLSTPRVALSPADNRVASQFGVAVRERLLGGRWQGRLVMKSGLRYEPADHTVRLVAVRVDDFVLEGAGAAAPVEKLGAMVAEQLLEGAVVYTLPGDRVAQWQRAGRVPSGVAVTPQGVELAFADTAR